MPKVEASFDSSTNFRGRLIDIFKDDAAEANDVVITEVGGEAHRVYGQFVMGTDYIEFQPESANNRLIVLPLDKIAHVMI